MELGRTVGTTRLTSGTVVFGLGWSPGQVRRIVTAPLIVMEPQLRVLIEVWIKVFIVGQTQPLGPS